MAEDRLGACCPQRFEGPHPLSLGAAAYWSLVIALIVFVALRGSFNPDDLRAEQEAAKRDLAASKKAAADRQKIPRPTR